MKIVVIGSSNTDMVIKAERLPKPGETVMGHTFFTAAGGKGANQAVAAARAGGQVSFIAKVGDDLFGQQAIEGFKKEGIDTRHVFIDRESPSGVAQIMVDQKAENCIMVAPGANDKLRPEDIDQCWESIQEADILLMQLESPVPTIEYVLNKIDHQQTRVILNPAPAKSINEHCLQNLFLLSPNETETALLTGMETDQPHQILEAGKALLARGIQHVIITRGAEGCIWFSEKGHQTFKAFQVEATDTTAAGDVFNGVLCVALAQQKSMSEAIIQACAAAAISVTRDGAQTSAPSRSEIETFIAARS